MWKQSFFCLLLFILDRLLKQYILFQPATFFKPGGFFVLQLNQKFAWFWDFSGGWLYLVLGLIIVILFYFWLAAIKKKNVLSWAWVLIIIGAISNLLDRIFRGAVVDFINFFGLTVINISDVYIFVGVVCLLWQEFFKNNKKILS